MQDNLVVLLICPYFSWKEHLMPQHARMFWIISCNHLCGRRLQMTPCCSTSLHKTMSRRTWMSKFIEEELYLPAQIFGVNWRRARLSHQTSVSDLTYFASEKMFKNLHKYNPKPCGNISQKGWIHCKRIRQDNIRP